MTNPDTITVSGLGTFSVRDSISSKRDVVSGVLRYRATDRLTLKGEYIRTRIDRTPAVVGTPSGIATLASGRAESTTKNTAKVGFNYRILKKITLPGRLQRDQRGQSRPTRRTRTRRATRG